MLSFIAEIPSAFATVRQRIVLLDPERLAEAYDGAAGAKVTGDWNPGR